MDRSEEEEQLPPGFRFHPTDEELITYYLRNKIIEASFDARAIAEVDLNKCEPWDLPGKARMGEKEWYFFSLRDRKYPTGVRTNRATNAGYWKTTGKDKEIFDNSISAELVGTKKTLVFYKGRAPRGEKTNWIMHEYRLHSKSAFKGNKEEWVVCRVFMKSCGYKKYPSNQHRADPFHLEMAPPIMPSLLQNDLINCHFGVGRNYLANGELMELSKLAPRGTHGFKLPIQLNYSGSFTPPSGAPPPTVLHATPVPLSQPQVASSSLPTNCIVGGFSPDANSMVTGARYRNMDSCVEIEGYWSPY